MFFKSSYKKGFDLKSLEVYYTDLLYLTKKTGIKILSQELKYFLNDI